MSDTPRTDEQAIRAWMDLQNMTTFARQLETELVRVTEQRDKLAKAIANHNEEALHASTTKNADKKLWDTLADMEGLNYD